MIAAATRYGAPRSYLQLRAVLLRWLPFPLLPHNLLQAQRDYFGAHTYERIDAPRGKFFALDWPVEGRPLSEV